MPDIIDLGDSSDITPAGIDDREQNSDLDSQSFKERLAKCLEEVDGNDIGSFATSGPLPQAANPGLHIHGLGSIELPLSEHDACEIKKNCHQAPFGKGAETIVDTNVRNTWELNPSDFDLKNPQWNAFLEQALDKVKQSLGIGGKTSEIHAELYKLLLYEQGAFFETHREQAVHCLQLRRF